MIKAVLNHRLFLMLEFLVLCIGVPSLIILTQSKAFMFSFLWGAALYCVVIYRLCYFTSGHALWNWHEINWRNLKPMLIRWGLASAALLVFAYFYDPERLFYIPRERPEIIPFLLVMYPVLSALPQEFIFCSFFFRRYVRYFGRGTWMIICSAIIFAYAHVLYINPVAPTLSFFGGLIFAQTYWKHKSLALVTLEHGLYGNSLFLIGLGWYFYSGAP